MHGAGGAWCNKGRGKAQGKEAEAAPGHTVAMAGLVLIGVAFSFISPFCPGVGLFLLLFLSSP